MEASGPGSGSVPWGNETARWPQNGEGDSKHNSVNFSRMNRRGLQHQKGEKREEKKKRGREMWNEIKLKQKHSEGCERKGKQRTKGKSTKGQDRRRRTTEEKTKENKAKNT